MSKIPIENLLSRLEGLKKTGQDQWIARCPGHEDRSPSLAIKEADDRILLKCFAGCSAYEVVNSIELEITDLFPPQETSNEPTYKNRSIRKPFSPSTLLQTISHETLIILTAAHDLSEGKHLSQEDHQRLITAGGRIYRAANYGGLT